MADRGGSPETPTLAAAIRARDPEALRRIAAAPIKPRNDNLVARPWGGKRLGPYKGVGSAAAEPWGEAFEISAFSGDREAAANPSVIPLADGSEIALPELLAAAGPEILGERFVATHGTELPLLPKTLDVGGLLSVQAHPAGNTEVYVILEAEPGATIRLGFSRDIDPGVLGRRLEEGRELQRRLVDSLAGGVDLALLQATLADFFSRRGEPVESVLSALEPMAGSTPPVDVAETVRRLKAVYWEVLDLLNEVPVAPGQVIYNATPAAAGDRRERPRSAEVHALGNPEGREILALEIRRPGPTFRAWDHVRFPVRPVDVDRALGALNLEATRPEDFIVVPEAHAERPGVFRSVTDDAFVVDHLRPRPGASVFQPPVSTPHTLHAIRGRVWLEAPGGRPLGSLVRGESALVPVSVGPYLLATSDEEAEVVMVTLPAGGSAAPGDRPPSAKSRNLQDLRRVVRSSTGPGQVIAIANGGDAEIVGGSLRRLAPEIFRADGAVEILVHEERTRRGQLLGLLDALRHWREAGRGLDPDSVAVGIMLPGRGTRLSPLTQRLHGIKPFMPMLIRQGPGRPWLNGAAASLYTWTLVAHHLRRLGFRGVAWKWGDEPQIPDLSLAAMDIDLSGADAVRFGSEVEITEDLAANKEWLLRDPATARLVMQVRRRPRAELLRRFGIPDDGRPAKALVHIGSPAFSYPFLEEAEAVFGGLDGWIDVDGYLFEALTHDPDAWGAELERDPGLRALTAERPDFYARVQRLRRGLEERRGRPFAAKVIDFGEGLYWGDIGQLARARAALWAVADPSAAGEFARQLAAIDGVEPDAFGNRVAGDCAVPGDGRVRDSVLIDARLRGTADVAGAVIVDSELGDVRLEPGAVVHGCTVARLEVGANGFAFRSVGEALNVPAEHVHTSLPVDPAAPARGIEDWFADTREDPGRGTHYTVPREGNPGSFAAKFEQMRQRRVPPDEVERAIDARFRGAIAKRLG